jgi:hypothetical protein
MDMQFLKMKITFMLLLGAVTVYSQDSLRILTVEQQREDFAFLRQLLKEAHPGMYRYTEPKQWDSLETSIESQLQHTMKEDEFGKIIFPYAIALQCTHTKFFPGEKVDNPFYYHTNNLLPLDVYATNEKLYIKKLLTGNHEIPEGSEIVNINGRASDSIRIQLEKFIFSDANIRSTKRLDLSEYFAAYYANWIEAPSNFEIKYKKGDRFATATLDAIDEKKWRSFHSAGQQSPVLQFSWADSLTAIIHIRNFDFPNKHAEITAFLEKTFAEINAKQGRNLVIDLRDNEGGTDKYGALLLSYLMDTTFRYYDHISTNTNKKFSFADKIWVPPHFGIYRFLIGKDKKYGYVWKRHVNLKPQQPSLNNFKGKVYVLMNGKSLSVTSEFISMVNYYQRAIFIGEESGGAYYGNNSGFFAIAHLPHSNYTVGIPLRAYYVAVNKPGWKNHGTLPDFEVIPGIDDVMSEKDAVMDFALDIIHNK